MKRTSGLRVLGNLFGISFAGAILFACQAFAQDEQHSGPPDPPSAASNATPPNTTPPNTTPSKLTKNGTSKDRLFYTLPNFLTLENASDVPPMTAGEKFKAVARSTFDPVQYPWWAFLAGINQAENSEPGYGQGAVGYAKRYGSTMGDGITENFMVGAVFPSFLHQDPRFYQSGKGGFMHRLGYAMSRIVVTRGDSGKEQFNFSEILGSSSAAAISTYSYHPHDDKTLTNAASVWATEIAYDTLTLVAKEFWPDIRKKLNHKHSTDASQPQ